jgi:hypothetical protein
VSAGTIHPDNDLTTELLESYNMQLIGVLVGTSYSDAIVGHSGYYSFMLSVNDSDGDKPLYSL